MTITDDQAAMMCDNYCRMPYQVHDDEKLENICLTCPMNGAEVDAPDRPELPKWGGGGCLSARKKSLLPIILGMTPPNKEILIFPHRHYDGTPAGYDLMINSAVFPDGTKRGQEFTLQNEVERINTRGVIHFVDLETVEMFGRMLVEYAEKRKHHDES